MRYLIIFLFLFSNITFAEEIRLKCISMCKKNSFEDCYKEEFKKWEVFKWKKEDIESQIKSGISNFRITQEKNLVREGKYPLIRSLALENNEYYVYLMAFPQTETSGNLQIIGINRTNLNYVLRNIANVKMNRQNGIVFPEFLSSNNILDSKKVTYYLNNIFLDYLKKGDLPDTNLSNCNLEKVIKNKF